MKNQFCHKIVLILIVLIAPFVLRANSVNESHPLLIISSYNPTAVATQPNIASFIEEFQRLGATYEVALENLNCESFSESPLWKERMIELLKKYSGNQSPALVLILGQEAWATYLSIDDSLKVDVPVLVSQASNNYIPLPSVGESPMTYMPDSYTFYTPQTSSSMA